MRKPKKRPYFLPSLRIVALVLALSGLGGVRLPVPGFEGSLVVLIDASDSIGGAELEESRRKTVALLSALDPRERAAVLSFAEKPLVVVPFAPKAKAVAELEAARLSPSGTGTTDISAALLTAAEMLRDKSAPRIVLIGDGRQTAGASLALAGLGRSGIPIFAIPTGRKGSDIGSVRLDAPSVARPGETIPVSLSFDSRRKDAISVELFVDGILEERRALDARSGKNRAEFSVRGGTRGARLVEARVVVEEGSPVTGARALSLVSIEGTAKVLVAAKTGSVSPIAAALLAQGLPSEPVAAERLPSSFLGYLGVSAIVLDDIPALAMTEAQQDALVEFVASGGGLLVVGGPSSLGRGEYYSTPLEGILPVSTDTRRRILYTRARILFAIDHSGSMAESAGPPVKAERSGEAVPAVRSKLRAAIEGVAAAVEGLNPQDEVGIIGFDAVPTWILPFTPADKTARILDSLAFEGGGGGTDLSSVFGEIVAGFGPPGPTKRHAIILTDGLTAQADYQALSAELAANNISASTIGIGPVVNDELLARIARWNGGEYYRAELDDIPRVIDRETVRATRDLLREGRISLRRSSDSSVVEGVLDDARPIGGYVVVERKPLAAVLIEAESEEGAFDPILSAWNYGRGRVAVFASDSGERWLSSWIGGDAYNRLWAQTIRSVEKKGGEGRLRAEARVEGAEARIVVEARDEAGRAGRGLSIRGTMAALDPAEAGSDGSGASGQGAMRDFGLTEKAPGRYEAIIELGGEGMFRLEFTEEISGASASVLAIAQKESEGESGPDSRTLEWLAEETGGALLAAPESSLPPRKGSWSFISAGPLLVLAALLLFLAELVARSAVVGHFSRALSDARERRARVDAQAAAFERPKRSEARRTSSGGFFSLIALFALASFPFREAVAQTPYGAPAQGSKAETWYVAGPFARTDMKAFAEPLEADHFAAEGGETRIAPGPIQAAASIPWTEVEGIEGKPDLSEIGGSALDDTAYAYRRFEAEEAGARILSLASHGAVKLSLNGAIVYNEPGARREKGERFVLVNVKKGGNELLAKSLRGVGAFSFSARLLRADAYAAERTGRARSAAKNDAAKEQSKAGASRSRAFILLHERIIAKGGVLRGLLAVDSVEWPSGNRELVVRDRAGTELGRFECVAGASFSFDLPVGYEGPASISLASGASSSGADGGVSFLAGNAEAFRSGAVAAGRALARAARYSIAYRAAVGESYAADEGREAIDLEASCSHLADLLEGLGPEAPAHFERALSAALGIEAFRRGGNRAGERLGEAREYALRDTRNASLVPYSVSRLPSPTVAGKRALVIVIGPSPLIPGTAPLFDEGGIEPLGAGIRDGAIGDRHLGASATVLSLGGSSGSSTEGADSTVAAIDRLARAYEADRDRIYLAGFGEGGRRALAVALAAPDKFAAVAVFGAGSPQERLEAVGTLPLLVVNGERGGTNFPLDRVSLERLAEEAPALRVERTKGGDTEAWSSWIAQEGPAKLFSHFAGYRRNAWPLVVRLASPAPRIGSAFWLTRLVPSEGKARAFVSIVDERHVEVEVSGASSITLDLRHPSLAKSGRILIGISGRAIAADAGLSSARFDYSPATGLFARSP